MKFYNILNPSFLYVSRIINVISKMTYLVDVFKPQKEWLVNYPTMMANINDLANSHWWQIVLTMKF